MFEKRLPLGPMIEMTYTTAAQALGVGRQTYSNWLNGRSPVPNVADLACAAIAAHIQPYSKNKLNLQPE